MINCIFINLLSKLNIFLIIQIILIQLTTLISYNQITWLYILKQCNLIKNYYIFLNIFVYILKFNLSTNMSCTYCLLINFLQIKYLICLWDIFNCLIFRNFINLQTKYSNNFTYYLINKVILNYYLIFQIWYILFYF